MLHEDLFTPSSSCRLLKSAKVPHTWHEDENMFSAACKSELAEGEVFSCCLGARSGPSPSRPAKAPEALAMRPLVPPAAVPIASCMLLDEHDSGGCVLSFPRTRCSQPSNDSKLQHNWLASGWTHREPQTLPVIAVVGRRAKHCAHTNGGNGFAWSAQARPPPPHALWVPLAAPATAPPRCGSRPAQTRCNHL